MTSMTNERALEEAVEAALRTLGGEEGQVPEEGPFPARSVSFANPRPELHVGQITLSIGASPPVPPANSLDKRYLAVTLTTPSGGSDSQKWIAFGDKDDVFRKLRDAGMAARAVSAIEEGALGLRQHGLK
jgi:hypothetical protein